MENEESQEERQILCSGCLAVVPESQVHVIPTFNADLGGYVTTFRCTRCWEGSLEETRARLADTDDEAEIASMGGFFERHAFILHEYERGDPMPVVRGLLVHMLGTVKTGAIRLSVGPTVPYLESDD